MLNVAVDRNTWHRGKGLKGSRLLRPDGKKCCIGFLGIELGVCKKELLGLKVLGEVEVGAIETFSLKHEIRLMRAYETNDDTKITEAVREARLIDIGQGMNVNFSFIN